MSSGTVGFPQPPFGATRFASMQSCRSARRKPTMPRPRRTYATRPVREIILDLDSSVSETYGQQEGTAHNGHFGCTCYHPLFCFNQFGDQDIHRFFRGDAAFARPELYEYLEVEGYLYAIRLPANAVLYREMEPLLKRPVGRPPNKPVVWYHDFRYQTGSWDRPRRVVAKIEHHKGELFPRVGFIVTNLRRKPRHVVKFYNGRGTAEQWIKEGKNAVKWTKLSCHDFLDNQVRLQLFALAYKPGQLTPTVGSAAFGATLVADDAAGDAHQDRREGDDPCRVRHLPDGRGGRAQAPVPGDSGADPTAAVAPGTGESRMNRGHHANLARRERPRNRMERDGQAWPCWPQREPFGSLASAPRCPAGPGRIFSLAFCGGLESSSKGLASGAAQESNGKSRVRHEGVFRVRTRMPGA